MNEQDDPLDDPTEYWNCSTCGKGLTSADLYIDTIIEHGVCVDVKFYCESCNEDKYAREKEPNE